MSLKTKSILNRFLKGFGSGAITAMGLVTVAAPTVWNDVFALLNTLALAGIFGGINGLLLAGQKWASWED